MGMIALTTIIITTAAAMIIMFPGAWPDSQTSVLSGMAPSDAVFQAENQDGSEVSSL